MERTRASHSSTYGQACVNCYKAKCRCVRDSAGQDCERCTRLKKKCQPSASLRKSGAQRTGESDARIAQLEGKLDTLLSAMQSAISSNGTPADILQRFNEETNSSSTSVSSGTLANTASTNLSSNEGPMPVTDSNPFSLAQDDPLSPYDPSPSQAEECLDFFRSRMLPCFPFINLSPDITARALRQNRPYLFQAILAVTTFSTNKKLAQAEKLKRVIFTAALLDVQSSIDLLLGLLTYIAWSTDAFLGRADLLSRLMMLAISLVYDLRLFKLTAPDVQLMMTITQGRSDQRDRIAMDETEQGFMEKQRALLACFVLSSNISSHLGRQDALRWTPQMEEALHVVATNTSCPTDEAFALQVRLHLLKERAAHIRQQNEKVGARASTASASTSIPGLMYLKSLLEQLRELRSSFHPGLYQIDGCDTQMVRADILIMESQYVELYINQLAYSMSRDSPPLNTTGQRSDGGLLPGFERLECLWQSLENVKSWLDSFYKIPSEKLVGLHFHFWSQMILCVTVLKYLSSLEDPAWDRQAVRNTVDLISTVDFMAQKLHMSHKEPGLSDDDSLFSLLSRLLDRCRLWAEARFTTSSQTQTQAQDVNVEPSMTSHNSHIPDLDQLAWMQSMDLTNDQWFDNVLGVSTGFY